MPSIKPHQPVPGTTIFDGEQARKGYALNKMCYSFNEAANRAAFLADEDATAQLRTGRRTTRGDPQPQRAALIEAGGNAYYLAKFAGIFRLDMQDIGAQQTGVTKDEFKARLLAGEGGNNHGADRRHHHHVARARHRWRDRQRSAK